MFTLLKSNFLYYAFIILSAHFISSGRLSGDAFYILQDAIKFSQNLDLHELQNLLPRRYVIFIYCLIPTQLFNLILPAMYDKELFYIAQVFISFMTSFLWLLTLILTCKLFQNSFKSFTKLFVIFYFFCTPMIFLSNELVQENLIILFIIVFIYLEKSKCSKSKLFMNMSLFFIILLKIYFIPLIIYLLIFSKRFSKFEKIITFVLLLIISFTIYFLVPNLLELRSSSNTFIFVKNFDEFGENLYRYFFSTNYGFFSTFHLFSLLFIYFLIKEKKFLLLSLNIFFISFFCLFPYWHGDLAGSRYMLPVNFLNLCVILPYLNKNTFIKKFKNYFVSLFTVMWIFTINCLDYDIASLNRYKDGAALSKINQIKYLREDLFTYENFPYFSLELHPFIFATNIRWNKLILKNDIVKFNQDEFFLESSKIYPRSIYSVIEYIDTNSSMVSNINNKLLSSFLKPVTLSNILLALKIFSLLTVLSTPLIIFKFVI